MGRLSCTEHITHHKPLHVLHVCQIYRCGGRQERNFLRDHFLSRQSMIQIDDMRRQFKDLLRDIGFVTVSPVTLPQHNITAMHCDSRKLRQSALHVVLHRTVHC
jgi:hypothetical protein